MIPMQWIGSTLAGLGMVVLGCFAIVAICQFIGFVAGVSIEDNEVDQ